jgi:hypothetical protein
MITPDDSHTFHAWASSVPVVNRAEIVEFWMLADVLR